MTFYTLNTQFGIGRSEVLIDANMTEMEHKMSEMTDRRIKVNFICVGANNDTYRSFNPHPIRILFRPVQHMIFIDWST